MSSESRPTYYGWYILAATFLVVFMGMSFRWSFGIFFKPMLEEFQLSRAALSLPVSLSLILFGVAQPVAGLLIPRFGSKIIISIGMLLTGIALFGMSQISSIWGIYFFYGFLLAFGGIGGSFTSVTPILSNWFQERRGMAFSIASTGSSIGQLVMLPLLAFLIVTIGWRSTFFWSSILLLGVMVPLCALVLRNRRADEKESGAGTSGGPAGAARYVPYDLPWVQCLHKIPFVLLVTSFFTCGFTVTIMAIHWIPFATDVGFSTTTAVSAFAIGGALNTVGVLIIGPASDKLGRKVPLGLVYIFRGLGFILFIFFKNDLTVWVVPMMIGLSWIATVPLTSALTGDFFGTRNVGVLFGLISLSHQLGSGLGAWLSGYIFDTTGSYNLAFALGAYLCFQAAVLVSLIRESETRAAPPGAEASPA